jgi:hypothetical protein
LMQAGRSSLRLLLDLRLAQLVMVFLMSLSDAVVGAARRHHVTADPGRGVRDDRVVQVGLRVRGLGSDSGAGVRRWREGEKPELCRRRLQSARASLEITVGGVSRVEIARSTSWLWAATARAPVLPTTTHRRGGRPCQRS